VRHAENNSRAVDETITELHSDQHVVVVRLSYVEDTSRTLDESRDEVDGRDAGVALQNLSQSLVINRAARS
jgi:hypothetical protein